MFLRCLTKQDPKQIYCQTMLLCGHGYLLLVNVKDVANSLYAAIITDTGGFRYRNTSRETLCAAAGLVEAGADPQWLSENIYENNPREKISLLTKVLETMTFDLDGKVSSMVVNLIFCFVSGKYE